MAKRLVGGITFIGLGVFLTFWMWHMADTDGQYYPKLAWVGPMFGVLGLAILVLPHYRDERAARGEDTTKLAGASLVTPRWWIALGLAFAAGITNGVLIEITHGGDPWPTLGGCLLAVVMMIKLFRDTQPKGAGRGTHDDNASYSNITEGTGRGDWTCPQCHKENPESVYRCGHCGSSLL